MLAPWGRRPGIRGSGMWNRTGCMRASGLALSPARADVERRPAGDDNHREHGGRQLADRESHEESATIVTAVRLHDVSQRRVQGHVGEAAEPSGEVEALSELQY